MSISITCPSCGSAYQVKPELAGKRVQCRCGEAVQVPAQGQAAPQPQQSHDLLGASNWQAESAAPPAAPQSPLGQPSGMLQSSGFAMGSQRKRRKSKPRLTAANMLNFAGATGLIVHGPVFAYYSGRILSGLFDEASGYDAFGWIFLLLILLAFVLSIVMFGFGVCVVIESIAEMTGTSCRMGWATLVEVTCSASFLGTVVVAALVAILKTILRIAKLAEQGANFPVSVYFKATVIPLALVLVVSVVPAFCVAVYYIDRNAD